MAISSNIILPAFALSRNPYQIQLSTPDAITTAGVRAQKDILVTSQPDDDDEITFTWSWQGVDYSATLTFKDSPNADNYEIQTDTSDAAYIENEVIPAFLGHPDLAEFFEFELYFPDPAYGFTIRAREQYTGDLNLAVSETGYPITEDSSTAGVDEVRPADYMASVWLFIGSAHNTPESEMIRIGELELFPDDQNLANLDLSGLMDAHFTEPEIPTDTAGAPVLCTEITRPFWILYGQKYGSPQSRRKQFLINEKYAIKGGFRLDDFAAIDCIDWVENNFLTHRTTREIFADQVDWLFWHNRDKNILGYDVGWRANIFFDDGTQTADNLHVDTGSALVFGKTYQFRADLVGSGIKAIADGLGKTVHHYDIYMIIKDPDSASINSISNTVRFIIREPDALGFVLEYENSLGAIESWAMLGNRALAGQITAEKYRTGYVPNPLSAIIQELQSYNEQDQPIIEMNTGPMSQTDARAFPDFMRSRHKWIRSGSHRVPVQIADSKYLVDGQNIESDFTRNQKFSLALPPSKSVSNLTEFWK